MSNPPSSNIARLPDQQSHGHGFGTFPVFLACVTTILGAIVFLRMGYAVSHTGLLGAIGIIMLGHAVTVPTAFAVAEIATNRRVEGGGEYFIISRSFGQSIGGAIGVSLFLSQAISIAFYMAAFAESFTIFEPWLLENTPLPFFDTRMAALPLTLLLGAVIMWRGAGQGIKILAIVTLIQFLGILAFFLGGTPEGVEVENIAWFSDLENTDAFMLVFAVCFTGFTGLTAGVGLSGDLKDPSKSIPRGIITAVLFSLVVYILIVWKIAVSVPLQMAFDDQLIMATISVSAPLVLIGLACSTLTSALGSILVAPRTLQALGKDEFSPSNWFNNFVCKGTGSENEPRNATFLAMVIALFMVSFGSVDSIARVVSMFFMVTYGSLCLIAFLEHFAARPAYRPTFKSRWWFSLFGAVMCFMLMFLMEPVFAAIAVSALVLLYQFIRRSKADDTDGLAALFGGVMAQLTRYFQVKLQSNKPSDWRPSIIMISDRTFQRTVPRRFLIWLSWRHGFATYIHYIKGMLTRETYEEGEALLQKLLNDPIIQESNLYVDTMISPSMYSALAQTLQVPGVSGVDNNTIFFEFSLGDPPEVRDQIVQSCELALATEINQLVLRHGEHFFGNHRSIHIWLTWHDYQNAGLMIILAYILLAEPEWEHAEISIYAAYPIDEVKEREEILMGMIHEGRIPVAPKNIKIIPTTDSSNFQELVFRHSQDADLVILGFTEARLERLGADVFMRHERLKDVLFVSAHEKIVID